MSSVSHGKGKEKGKKKDRLPKLTLHCVKDESVAECLFDTHKNARITFQFGLKEDAPEDIADKMVCYTRFFYVEFNMKVSFN